MDYDGEWREDKREGRGACTWAVGTRYETNTMTFGTRVFSPPGDPSLSP